MWINSRSGIPLAEPTATVLEQGNVFREDVVRPSLPIDNVLANAPTHEADHFCVPKIIE